VPPPDRESFDRPPTRARRDPAKSGPPRSARALVHRQLASQARRYPDLDIAPLETDGLDARDAALAHAICDAAIRRWLTLEFLLNTRLSTPLAELEPKLQAVLLAGAAQIFLLDRLPAHAVINEAVEWSKRAIRPGAGAMVNAVLRKMSALRGDRRPAWSDARDALPLDDGAALSLTEPVLPEDALARLGIATSHPRWLLERWIRAFGPDQTRAVALHGLIHPPTILNTGHTLTPPPEELTTPHRAPGHHVFTGDRAALIDLLHTRPDLWVQDPASSLAVGSLDNVRPGVIADVCAGQGTKTRQLAARFPSARIIASDADSRRLAQLREFFRSSEQVIVADPATVRRDWAGRVDLALLDVPCSNTGVLARRVEARYRGPEALERLLGTQRQIIADSIPLLAPRAAILYSTCSLEPEENQSQAAWARKWHHYKITDTRSTLPRGEPGGSSTSYSDGSFSCLLHTS
jgi:16S rRNA (cytosine967-C5)-methyltransferase